MSKNTLHLRTYREQTLISNESVYGYVPKRNAPVEQSDRYKKNGGTKPREPRAQDRSEVDAELACKRAQAGTVHSL